MDNRKLLIFGFAACILAALAYVFVFADLPFATPETPAATDAAPAPAPAPEILDPSTPYPRQRCTAS
jgi:hypothetical protein